MSWLASVDWTGVGVAAIALWQGIKEARARLAKKRQADDEKRTAASLTALHELANAEREIERGRGRCRFEFPVPANASRAERCVLPNGHTSPHHAG